MQKLLTKKVLFYIRFKILKGGKAFNMFRKLSKIVICGSIAIFCTLFANPNATQTINTQNAASIIQMDNLRVQNLSSDSIISIQERSAVDILIEEAVSLVNQAQDFVGNSLCMTSYAQSSFSSYWYQDTATGAWKIRDGSGQMIRDSWVCDDAVNPTNPSWYLIDSNGNMREGLVQDEYGNFYLLCPEHAGVYGSLISNTYSYQNRTLYFNSMHDGTFGRITNPEALSGLSYTTVNLAGKPSLYTSQFNVYGGGNSGNYGTSGGSGSGYGAGNSLGGNSGALSAGNSGSVQSTTNGSGRTATGELTGEYFQREIDRGLDKSKFSQEFLNGYVSFS